MFYYLFIETPCEGIVKDHHLSNVPMDSIQSIHGADPGVPLWPSEVWIQK